MKRKQVFVVALWRSWRSVKSRHESVGGSSIVKEIVTGKRNQSKRKMSKSGAMPKGCSINIFKEIKFLVRM